MQKATTDQIRRANVDKMAAKYGIEPRFVAGYMKLELEHRGYSNGYVEADQSRT